MFRRTALKSGKAVISYGTSMLFFSSTPLCSSHETSSSSSCNGSDIDIRLCITTKPVTTRDNFSVPNPPPLDHQTSSSTFSAVTFSSDNIEFVIANITDDFNNDTSITKKAPVFNLDFLELSAESHQASRQQQVTTTSSSSLANSSSTAPTISLGDIQEFNLDFFEGSAESHQASRQQQVSVTQAYHFPTQLHDMLDEAEAKGHAPIVSWNLDGQSFTIHQSGLALVPIIGRYFRQTKYKSFLAQLRGYEFTRITHGEWKGRCSHPQLQRGLRSKSLLMKRKPAASAAANAKKLVVPSVASVAGEASTTTGIAPSTTLAPKEETMKKKPKKQGGVVGADATQTTATTTRKKKITKGNPASKKKKQQPTSAGEAAAAENSAFPETTPHGQQQEGQQQSILRFAELSSSSQKRKRTDSMNHSIEQKKPPPPTTTTATATLPVPNNVWSNAVPNNVWSNAALTDDVSSNIAVTTKNQLKNQVVIDVDASIIVHPDMMKFSDIQKLMDNNKLPFVTIGSIDGRSISTTASPEKKVRMHQTSTERMNVRDRKKDQKPKLYFDEASPNSLIEGAESLSKLDLVQKFLPATGEVGKRIKIALTAGGQAVTQIDHNITLFSANARLIPQLLVDNEIFPADFIDADLKVKLNELPSRTLDIPLLFDKSTNILSFFYYWIGCPGQYNGVDGLLATALVNAMNKKNPFLDSLSIGNNHSNPLYGDRLMEWPYAQESASDYTSKKRRIASTTLAAVPDEKIQSIIHDHENDDAPTTKIGPTTSAGRNAVSLSSSSLLSKKDEAISTLYRTMLNTTGLTAEKVKYKMTVDGIQQHIQNAVLSQEATNETTATARNDKKETHEERQTRLKREARAYAMLGYPKNKKTAKGGASRKSEVIDVRSNSATFRPPITETTYQYNPSFRPPITETAQPSSASTSASVAVDEVVPVRQERKSRWGPRLIPRQPGISSSSVVIAVESENNNNKQDSDNGDRDDGDSSVNNNTTTTTIPGTNLTTTDNPTHTPTPTYTAIPGVGTSDILSGRGTSVMPHPGNTVLRSIVTSIPRTFDVLSGRGYGAMHHPGNTVLRSIVTSKLDEYVNLKYKEEKKEFTMNVVQLLKNQYGTRFLKEEKIESDDKWWCWNEVSDEAARDKVRISFRDKNKLQKLTKPHEPTPTAASTPM